MWCILRFNLAEYTLESNCHHIRRIRHYLQYVDPQNVIISERSVYGTNNAVSTTFVDRYRSVESSQKNLTGIWRDFVHMILLL